MQYIITKMTDTTTRHPVATLPEARDTVVAMSGEPISLASLYAMSENNGTIGRLPDGTVIQIEQVVATPPRPKRRPDWIGIAILGSVFLACCLPLIGYVIWQIRQVIGV